MRCSNVLVLIGFFALPGCTTMGGLDRLSLPEDEQATTERIERVVQPGMPVEQARRMLERYGFRCRYEEAIGVPYLYGVQVKEKRRWPFRGVWATTVYHQNGLVTAVRGHYQPMVVERGILIPPRTFRRFPAAPPKPGATPAPTTADKKGVQVAGKRSVP